MNDIEKIDAMIRQLRELKSGISRMSKLSDKDYRDLTPKQAQKISADKDWIGMDLIKRRHELHALAVELGFAERRDSYNVIELRDNWHVFNYQPREPNAASKPSKKALLMAHAAINKALGHCPIPTRNATKR